MLARAYIEEDYYTTAIELLNKVISKTNDSTAIELKEEAQERKEIYLYENKSKSQGKKTSNYSEQDSYNSETNKSYNKLKQSYSNQNMSQSDNQIDNVDFGPYMRELQRRIKQNWHPPKGQESRRVVLLFKIAKDGSLLSCKVDKTSGIPNVDQAAIDAVKLTSPFKSLPANYKGSSVDIQFSFDYNVFNSNNQKI